MEFTDLAAAVFAGNVMTLALFWGMVQFHKKDYKAPWLAYAGVAMPLLYTAASFLTNAG